MASDRERVETTDGTPLRAAARRHIARGRAKARRTAAELWAPCTEQLDLFGEITTESPTTTP